MLYEKLVIFLLRDLKHVRSFLILIVSAVSLCIHALLFFPLWFFFLKKFILKFWAFSDMLPQDNQFMLYEDGRGVESVHDAFLFPITLGIICF